MKPDCKVDMKALTEIVDDMLAEKNALGREAFKHMMGEDGYMEGVENIEDVEND